jgi:hypothetical protein
MRHALALHIAPLMLRLALGLTFVWAGAAKLTQEMPVTDQNRAQLAAWGVIEGPAATEADVPEITPDPQTPDGELLEAGEPPLPADMPAAEPPEPESEADDLTEPGSADEQASAEANAALVAFQIDAPERVRRVYGLALLINARANPAPKDDGSSVHAAVAPGPRRRLAACVFRLGRRRHRARRRHRRALRLLHPPRRAPARRHHGRGHVAHPPSAPPIQQGTATLGVPAARHVRLQCPAGQYVYTHGPLAGRAPAHGGALLLCTGPGFFSIDRLLFGPLQPAAPRYDDSDDGDVELVPMAGRQGVRPGDEA